MGITETDLAFISGIGPVPKRVCDLGDQELFCNDEEVFNRLGYSAPRRGKARDFWTALNVEYDALDVVGDAIYFDLNVESVPLNWKPYDLVTNCGTTEHVFNQANAFQVIHDLTAVGGLMYHQLPVSGYPTHGFFVYTLKFFKHLARWNKYEILKTHVDVVSELMDQRHILDPEPIDAWTEKLKADDGGVRVLMKRTSNADFVFPIDVPKTPTLVERAVRKVKRMVRNRIHLR